MLTQRKNKIPHFWRCHCNKNIVLIPWYYSMDAYVIIVRIRQNEQFVVWRHLFFNYFSYQEAYNPQQLLLIANITGWYNPLYTMAIYIPLELLYKHIFSYIFLVRFIHLCRVWIWLVISAFWSYIDLLIIRGLIRNDIISFCSLGQPRILLFVFYLFGNCNFRQSFLYH